VCRHATDTEQHEAECQNPGPALDWHSNINITRTKWFHSVIVKRSTNEGVMILVRFRNFLRSLVQFCPTDEDLLDGYRQMAQDELREAEALDWIEGMLPG